jgi:arylsulfatase A-like enzyme
MKRLGVLVAGWLATLAILAGTVGIVRSLVLFSLGTLPDQYLVHSVVVNGALLLAIGVVLTPLTVVLGLAYRRRGKVPSWRPRVLLLAIVALTFWGLNTSIGFGVLREFFQGESRRLISGVRLWLPGMLCVVLLGAWLSTGNHLLFRPKRRHVTGSLLLLVFACGMGLYSYAKRPSGSSPLDFAPSASRQHPVVLILIDTLRADHLSCYGYELPTSPNLDALAAEGVLYSRTFAPAPWTRPSCAALLSSRYPPETGVDGTFFALPEDVPILPQFLQREGYRTAGIAASVQVSAQFGFAKGFDSYDTGSTYLPWTGTKTAFSRLGLVPFTDIYPRYDARELTDRALSWIERGRDRAPFFMYLHYADPHTPYQPPVDADRWREFATPLALRVDEPPPTPTWLGRALTQAETEAMVARYDAEIAFLDSELARLFGFLKQKDFWRETLVIVTADHGEEFLEHGGWAHASSLYKEQIHVPLIIKYPASLSVDHGQRVDHAASLIDIVPTIRDVLDAAWPDALLRGKSLLRKDEERATYPAYSRAYPQRLRALMRGSDKIIQKLDTSRQHIEEEKYYSMAEDFREQGDGRLVTTLDSKQLEEMRSILQVIDSQDSVATEEIVLDEETLRELEALGYLN